MNFKIDKINTICGELKKLSTEVISNIENIEYAVCEYKEQYENESVPEQNLLWQAFEKGMRFGGKDKHFMFRFNISTPSAPCNRDLSVVMNMGNSGNPQGLVYIDGSMVQGTDINHAEVMLEFEHQYHILVYFYTDMEDKWFDFAPTLNIIDKKIEKLYYDLSVPLESISYINPNSEEYINTLNVLDDTMPYIDMRVPKSDSFYTSVDEAINHLDKYFYNGICGKSNITVNCIGHTHIDVAWLWTIAQTREKAQRSFATVINLMKQYPEYKFMSSQPQLYAYVKKAAPELYAQIKKAVSEGRWEVEGAMWLEPDCNLISGESMVRQIMFGKRFIKKEFGVESRILWLPDVFGYSASMPQVLKKCGVDRFVTAKISWNETNQMPHDVFMWQGIDGTELFTVFLTKRDAKPYGESDIGDQTTDCNGYLRPSQILGTWNRFTDKDYSNEAIISFGFGDGGGGPTKDMLEQQKRLSYGLPAFPKTKVGFVGEHLNKLEKDFIRNSQRLHKYPKWVGELYLEFHRGTYTSMAKNKKNNRQCELSYQRIETLSVIDMLLGGKYPQKQINDAWQEILLNQFHDIIPGSAILEVYEGSDKSYARILHEADKIQENKLESIKKHIRTSGGMLVYNPNGFEVSGTVRIDGVTAYVENIPAFGYRVTKNLKNTNSIKVNEKLIENKFFKIMFENGKIVSVYDKRNNREIIKKGHYANEIQVFEDFPRCYDAWEISDYYKEKMWKVEELISQEIISDGTRAGIKQVWRYLESIIEQNIWLYEDIDRIDFETTVDWKQEHMIVKTAFPIDVNAQMATYDIQFGSLTRPTHKNTSWDEAKFEVCAHKWADISDNGYGVSLLNDCKYGYSAEDSILKLTLLKCATFPNPKADKEIHKFTYSLYPHKGDVYSADTIKYAYELNQPMIAESIEKSDGDMPEEFSLLSCDSENVIVETVKKAEDSDDIVIRMYESKNMRTNVNLTLGFDFKKAYICDMLENDIEEITTKGRLIPCSLGNFEIVTVKVKM